MNATRQLACLVLTLLFAIFQTADASILIDGTRFVYGSSSKDISVIVLNKAERPVLIKAWIDEGDVSAKADTVKTPFLLTPPLVRIEGNTSHTYRVILAGMQKNLPKNRESLFWLNFLEVPPKPSRAEKGGNEESTIQLAFQYRLKLFYRPDGLPGGPDKSAEGLRWISKKDVAGKVRIKAVNDGAHYVSLSKLTVSAGGKSAQAEPATVAPLSSQVFELPDLDSASGLEVSYQWIDDWGGLHDQRATVKAER